MVATEVAGHAARGWKSRKAAFYLLQQPLLLLAVALMLAIHALEHWPTRSGGSSSRSMVGSP
ncbi:MAG: hypothetical protein DYH12_11005 [Sorangiineae bacterium PRO1]|nr:hypothetical protein [Sorangiineae bacterium PRO1]